MDNLPFFSCLGGERFSFSLTGEGVHGISSTEISSPAAPFRRGFRFMTYCSKITVRTQLISNNKSIDF